MVRPNKSITVLIDEPVADAIEHEADRQHAPSRRYRGMS
jgi:hypothetical protein